MSIISFRFWQKGKEASFPAKESTIIPLNLTLVNSPLCLFWLLSYFFFYCGVINPVALALYNFKNTWERSGRKRAFLSTLLNTDVRFV